MTARKDSIFDVCSGLSSELERLSGAVWVQSSPRLHSCGFPSSRPSGDSPQRLDQGQLPAAEIPGLTALRAAIQSSRSYWQGNEKTDAFCNKALSWTDGDEVTVLEISDYGTKGLDGADGDRNGSWFGLVQSGGVSFNQDDAGGAFGIGKKAPFAGSFARTVFFLVLRRRVLSAYNNRCCITGLSVPALLTASHIIPWASDAVNRLNPR